MTSMGKSTLFSLIVLLSIAFVAYSQEEECIHKVTLKTGAVKDGGTDATVSLRLFDKEGNDVLVSNLRGFGTNPPGYDNYFERGYIDTFTVKTRCLESPVCKVELSHDNTGSNPGWYPLYIQIMSLTPPMISHTREFIFDQWLANDPGYSLTATRSFC